LRAIDAAAQFDVVPAQAGTQRLANIKTLGASLRWHDGAADRNR